MWEVRGEHVFARDTRRMIPGFHRTAVPYVWPNALAYDWPRRRTVYLDMNHWIGLAKAAQGHTGGGRYRDLLDEVRSLSQRGDIRFPLSGQHYMEMAKISSLRQREAVATLMVEISQFATLLCRSLIMRLELEALLDASIGARPTPYAPLRLLGEGVGHAFGVRGQLELREDSQGPAKVDTLRDELQYMAEWMILRGPRDEDLPHLAEHGFDPTVSRRSQTERVAQELEQRDRLDEDPRWRRGRLRDVVGARYVIVEMMDMLLEGLADRSATMGDLVSEGDRDAIREFVDAMPSGDVHVSLQVALHRNAESRWSPNDFFDIDALSVAVPYCDVVATDRQRVRDLEGAGCPARLGTTVVATPAALLEALHEL